MSLASQDLRKEATPTCSNVTNPVNLDVLYVGAGQGITVASIRKNKNRAYRVEMQWHQSDWRGEYYTIISSLQSTFFPFTHLLCYENCKIILQENFSLHSDCIPSVQHLQHIYKCCHTGLTHGWRTKAILSSACDSSALWSHNTWSWVGFVMSQKETWCLEQQCPHRDWSSTTHLE